LYSEYTDVQFIQVKLTKMSCIRTLSYAKYILFTLELHVINLIQPYMITFVIYLWQVGGFPLVSHIINLIQPYMMTFVILKVKSVVEEIKGVPHVDTTRLTRYDE
jgi:hypothetical protein